MTTNTTTQTTPTTAPNAEEENLVQLDEESLANVTGGDEVDHTGIGRGAIS